MLCQCSTKQPLFWDFAWHWLANNAISLIFSTYTTVVSFKFRQSGTLLSWIHYIPSKSRLWSWAVSCFKSKRWSIHIISALPSTRIVTKIEVTDSKDGHLGSYKISRHMDWTRTVYGLLHVILFRHVTRKLVGTWNMRPITNTIATHDTMSAWFWIKNSWLKIGGFLLLLLRRGAIFSSWSQTGDVDTQ